MRFLSSARSVLASLLVIGLLLTAMSPFGLPAVAAQEKTDRRPVLVELFTSEGCSSCPPADALLAKIDQLQPIPGVIVIVLSEHVTYWNQQGWHDPFSQEELTDRQRHYGERFKLDDVYTPQAVIDGSAQCVGSDARKLVDAVTSAAASPKTELTVQEAQWSGNVVHFSVHARVAGGSMTTLVAVLAEDSAQSSVVRGENAGKDLRHVAVVRVLKEMGSGTEDGRALTLKLPGKDKPGSMRLVAFVVDKRNGRVLAAAERAIAPTER